ncbi:LppA family lipoprotein [Mycobacterium sp. SMC-4]|uniref:LppA family lipoprotein n=1 Tax=Mycobacterium sp. SMC-4 TaxID=2857059 RepID=UPI003D03F2F3
MTWRPIPALCAALVLTLGGCGMADSPAPSASGEPGTSAELDELLQRPDAETVLADQDRMLAEIAAALTRIIPGSRWEPTNARSDVACAEFASTRGLKYYSPLYTSPTPVPPELWIASSDAVIEIARRHGYTGEVTRSPAPGPGQVSNLDVHDAVGGYVTFGSQKAASFGATTGCYLTAADKQAAH